MNNRQAQSAAWKRALDCCQRYGTTIADPYTILENAAKMFTSGDKFEVENANEEVNLEISSGWTEM